MPWAFLNVDGKGILSTWRNSTRNTRVMVTRYGNVMGSRGSVIPLFCQALQDNKPLPITVQI